MRWTVPLWGALLVGAVFGAASGGVAWVQATPSAAETRLRAQFRDFISSGETARDNWLPERVMFDFGHHNAHILHYREREIERWRERLQAVIREQTVLTVDDTMAYVMTTRGDRISGSIEALRFLLRDWRSFKI